MKDAVVVEVDLAIRENVVVITGGGAGIGAATARLMAAQGADVVIAEIDDALAAETAAAIEADGYRCRSITTDVRDADAVVALREQVLKEHGRVDVLVNNVGDFIRVPRDFLDSDPSLWAAQYAVNLEHVFRVTWEFLPHMIERRSGAVVNVSSIEGTRGYPQDPVYASFKAAVVQFTRSLGVQVAPYGVRVNGTAPDATLTHQIPFDLMVPKAGTSKWRATQEEIDKWRFWMPVQRFGTVEDQALAIAYLASPISAFIVGHTIPTDGGTGASGGWYQSDRRPDRVWTNRPLNP
jgi:NAD(P)-dependent dehydrogenase (short-subunit alcohol dehydrogenase family)